MKTDRLLADTKTIRYEETDLASLISAPYHFRCGIYLICTQGEAVVSTGVQKYIFNEQTELIFPTGGLLQVLETSGDLQVKMLMFPKEAFLNAMLPIDTPYFNYTHEHPCYHHTADERSQKTCAADQFVDGYGTNVVYRTDAPVRGTTRAQLFAKSAYVAV